MSIFIFLRTFVVIVFLSSNPILTNNSSENLKECKTLVGHGDIATKSGNYSQALEYYTKAEFIAEKNHLSEQLFGIYNSIGITYKSLSNYGEALGYYKKALDVAQKTGLEEKVPVILSNIGFLYSSGKEYNNAIEYFKKAYSFAKKAESNYSLNLIGLNISDTYNKIGNYKQARKYLKEIESLPKNEKFTQVWKINYAETFFLEGKVSEARKMMEDIFRNAYGNRDNNCYVCIMELLSKIYASEGENAIAIEYAKQGLKNAVEVKDRIEFYKRLSGLYKMSRNYDAALQYKDSVIAAKDSVSKLIATGLFESNKVKMKVQEYENELKVGREMQSAERILFITIIAFSLILFFFIYRWLKNKVIKQKQEKVIVENKQKISELELENLKNNISEKNRKLSAKALYLSGRNELIQGIVNALMDIKEVAQNKSVTDYIKSLKSHLKADAEWDDFIVHFEKVNPDFLNAIRTKHPNLSNNDIRFLCYVYMNLSLKEISTIFNITYNASRIRKRRILEKMGQDKETSLYAYIVQIV